MSVRSNGRNLSFEILSGYLPSAGEPSSGEVTPRRKRKRKPRKRKHDDDALNRKGASLETIRNSDDESLLLEAREVASREMDSRRSVCASTTTTVVSQVRDDVPGVRFSFELRQRNVNGGLGDADGGDAADNKKEVQEINGGFKREAQDVNAGLKGLEKEKSLDWNQVLRENTDFLHDSTFLEKSPLKYFMGEVYSGNSLRSTISVGNEKKRQRVYNTMFHVPWRCERLIVAGFFVCLDSFLSLLTIMPARILMTIWKLLKTRQLVRPNAAELADYGCFIVLGLGVASLQMIDISLIYHVIRGQGTIKLYVVYNVLEIFDKLCQSFGEDVLQVLFNSAEGLSCCSNDNLTSELTQFVLDEAIAVIAFDILPTVQLFSTCQCFVVVFVLGLGDAMLLIIVDTFTSNFLNSMMVSLDYLRT